MTRDEVLKEFDPRDQLSWHWEALDIAEVMADEIVRLRKDLAQADTASQILREVIEEQRQRIVNADAERVLAKLREPSEAVIKAGWEQCYGNFPADWDNIHNAIRAAVAAAEKEVQGER